MTTRQPSGGRTPAAVVCGVGGWVPPHAITNADLAARMDTSDEWIRSRTGIGRRYAVRAGTATSHLATEAGARALASAGAPGVDHVVLATTTPDRPCPATAPVVAARLGLAGVPAFDVSAVCSGFLYGLDVGAGLIAARAAERVLVIGAEAFTTLLDPEDRASVAIFGDGAGAVVLRAGTADEPGAVGRSVLGSDGTLADLITVRAGGAELPVTAETPRTDRYFDMRGREVFAHAVTRMAESTRAALDLAGWKPDEVDHVVGHQANLRILQAVAEQLDLPPDRLVVHLDRVGNTAAASIPLALADAAARGVLRPGDRLLLTAFGGGATWGATTLTWPGLGTRPLSPEPDQAQHDQAPHNQSQDD